MFMHIQWFNEATKKAYFSIPLVYYIKNKDIYISSQKHMCRQSPRATRHIKNVCVKNNNSLANIGNTLLLLSMTRFSLYDFTFLPKRFL